MFKPEIADITPGQVIHIQGHPATAVDVRHNPDRTDAQRILVKAAFTACPENRLVKGTGYDGSWYSLWSVYVPK